tara:strand:- start:714 stop:2792 length:2079 start_codon:yes stop_codon:yes gene_type:complete
MSTGIPLFRKIQSGLDLNGPQLNMQQQPVGTACSVASGIATFIGIGTAIYPPGQAGRNTNTGTVTHQWYKVSPAIKMVKLLPNAPIPDEYLTKLTEGVNFVGTATTTLTLKGLTSPTDNDGEYICRIGYTPNELSPNAVNEPFDSSIATVGVQPTLSITTQPADSTIVEGVNTTFNIVATNSDPSYDFGGETPTPLQYQWVLDGTDLVDGTIAGEGVVSGSKTDTLTISRTDAALYKVFCRVTSTNANPGIITSTEVKLDVATSRALLKFERYSQGTVTVEAEERDLAKLGSMSFRADANRNARIIAVWAPEEDVEVKVTLGGAAGAARNGNRGGTGGISVFRTTLIKGDEYIIKLGVNYEQGGGPRGGINGGGGICAIYHKAKMIAVAGGGGGAGTNGRGGDGGGLQVAGENGQGSASGQGGVVIEQGALPITGMTQAGRTGLRDFDNQSPGSGRISGCTIGGTYWTARFAHCVDIGQTKMNNVDGSTISNSTTLQRGYKPGQGHRNNGGAGSGNQGGGGAGARGGTGATNNGSGGGGASGYASDEVEILTSSVLPQGTQLGGNDDVAFICFEAYVPTDDFVPCIPPKSNDPNSLNTVHFNVTRSAAWSNTITFRKVSGFGPSRITWGPNGGRVSAQISPGAVYTLDSLTRGKLRLSGNTLQLEDSSDNDYNDLTVTPDRGRFTSSSRYVA